MNTITTPKSPGPMLVLLLVGLALTQILRAADPLPPEEIETLNDGIAAAIQAHDVPQIVSYFAADAIYDFVPLPAPMTRTNEIADFFTGLFHAFPDYATIAEERWIAGNVVVTAHTTLGAQENEWLGMPPTGAPPIPHQHLDVWDYDGDKIARVNTYIDTRTLMIKNGLLPPIELPPLVPSIELPNPTASGLDPVATVVEFQRLKNVPDIAGMAGLIAANALVYMAPFDTQLDRPTTIAVHEMILAGIPDFKFQVQRNIDLGDGWVVAEGAFTGTHTGLYLGIPPAGRPIQWRAAYIYHIDSGGLITEIRVFLDDITLLTQIGAFPPMAIEDLLAAYTVIRDAIMAHDADAMFAGMGDFFRYHFGPFPEPMNRDQGRDFFEAMFIGEPDYSIDHGLVLAQNNLVVVEHVATGTHLGDLYLGPFGVLLATGRPLETPHIDVFEFVAGENVRAVTYFDFQSHLIQLGVLPVPAELPPLEPSFEVPAPEPKDRSPLAATTESIAAWNAHDLSAFAKLKTDDVDLFVGPLGRSLTRAEYLAFQELQFAAFPDVHMQPWKIVDLGQGWVVFEVLWTATQQGPFFGIPPTGRSVMLPGVVLVRFNGQGLQTYEHVYYDNITLLAQLGVFDPLALIAKRTGDGIVLSWPLAASLGMVLETTDTLMHSAWSPVLTEPVAVGDQYQVTLQTTTTSAFFRLRQP